MLYSHISKDPRTELDYTIPWTDELGADDISSSSFPDFPTGEGLNLVSSSFNNGTIDKTVNLRLAGGTLGREYEFSNWVVGTSGQDYYWILHVTAEQPRSLRLDGPPFATIGEAESFHPAATGAEPLVIENLLQASASEVERLAPRPAPVTSTLRTVMDAVQKTVDVDEIKSFPNVGTVLIDSELIQYGGRESASPDFYPTSGPGTLTRCIRGRHATLPATHAVGVTVEDVEYPLKARMAELALFEWMWDTRGYKPSRSGVLGSETYSLDGGDMRRIVKRHMSGYYTGGGPGKAVPVRSLYPRSHQHGSYGSWYPRWFPR